MNTYLCYVYDTFSKCPASPFFLADSHQNATHSFIDWYVRSDYHFKDACCLKISDVDILCDDSAFSSLFDAKDAINVLSDFESFKDSNGFNIFDKEIDNV